MINILKGRRFNMSDEIYTIIGVGKNVCIVKNDSSTKTVYMRNVDINNYGMPMLKEILSKL